MCANITGETRAHRMYRLVSAHSSSNRITRLVTSFIQPLSLFCGRGFGGGEAICFLVPLLVVIIFPLLFIPLHHLFPV